MSTPSIIDQTHIISFYSVMVSVSTTDQPTLCQNVHTLRVSTFDPNPVASYLDVTSPTGEDFLIEIVAETLLRSDAGMIDIKVEATSTELPADHPDAIF